MMSDFQMCNIRPCKVLLAPLTVDMCYGIAPCWVVLTRLQENNLYTKGHNKTLKKQWTISKRCADENKMYLKSKMSDSSDSENESLMGSDSSTNENESVGISEASTSENISSGAKGSFAESVKELKAKLSPHRKEINLTATRKSNRSTKANINLSVEYLSRRYRGSSDSESIASSYSKNKSLKGSDSSYDVNESSSIASSYSENKSLTGSDSSYDVNESSGNDSSYTPSQKAKVKSRKIKEKNKPAQRKKRKYKKKEPEPLSDYEKMREIKMKEKMAYLKTLNFDEIEEMYGAEKKEPKVKKLKGRPKESTRERIPQIPMRCSSRSTQSKMYLCLDSLSKKSAGQRDSETSDSSDYT